MSGVRDLVMAAVGAVIGLYLGGVAGGLVGAGVASFVVTGGGLETLAPAVVGLVVGGTSGAMAGSWLGLRFVAARGAGLTAILLLPAQALTAVVAQLIGPSIFAPASVSPALLTALAAALARLVTMAAAPHEPTL